MAQQRPDIPWLAQIAARIVNPEHAARGRNEPDEAVAAIGDVEIGARRQVACSERRPIDAVVTHRRSTAIAHRDAMAARGETFGERHERSLGTAQGRVLGRRPVERDAVVGHDDAHHHAASPAMRSHRRRAAAAAAATLKLSISVSVVR